MYLVPWTDDLPLDLRGRFARDGRVTQVGREARLKRLFGVVDVDADAARSPLADWLLRPAIRLCSESLARSCEFCHVRVAGGAPDP